MKTDEFLLLLEENQNKSLYFEYRAGQFVAPNYHITEVKNITIDSVDCGAGTNFWKETIIQLWESAQEKETREYMSAEKALGILKKVDGIKPMEGNTEVKFEYGNADFHTAQLFVNDYEIRNDQLILNLNVEKMDCKAKDTCGVPVAANTKEEVYCNPESCCC